VGNEFARARRANSRLAVVMADIDRFKRINDNHGHLAGDAVLREISRRMKVAVRQYDSVGRYGGEEFLIVVPGSDLGNSVALAERLRRTVEDNPFVTPEATLGITCSFGVAWADRIGSLTLDQLLTGADSALYRAKRNGRNRVETTSISSDGAAAVEGGIVESCCAILPINRNLARPLA